MNAKFPWVVALLFLAAVLGAHFGSPFLIERDVRMAEESRVADLVVAEQQRVDIVREAEQLTALLRKIDGAQSTDPESLRVTNAAIDEALSSRGFTTIAELRTHALLLDSMYQATTELITVLKAPILDSRDIDCNRK